MTMFEILEALLIGPLKLVFEIIFSIANRVIGHPGLAIIFLSLTMNFLVLPLYRRADAMQEEARDTDLKLSKGIAHIKKTFSGDERMMILQTYYRQNHYSPLSALNGSVSLLLEIPFFMAAYQFLSHLEILNGVSFGPIADLGAPDGILVIGSVTLNLLPIAMTLINLISSYLYLKGFPLKTKIQLYAMALFFLFFLYDSPACLVFYWTLNNVFSLVKTIFYKLKNPRKVLTILASALGAAVLGYALVLYDQPSIKARLYILAFGMLLELPVLWPLVKKFLPRQKEEPKPDLWLFLLGALFLTVLTGVLIPSNFIAASPQEFVDVYYFHHPIWYIVNSLAMAAGTFLVWMGVFYWLATPGGRVFFGRLVWALCGIMLMNYMFFGTELGILSASLKYEDPMVFSPWNQLGNMLLILLLGGAMYLLSVRFPKQVAMVALTAVLTLGGMAGLNIAKINSSVASIAIDQGSEEVPSFRLSKNGKNVIVFMLDRAAGEYLPYIFAEKPELKEQFEGFTYYTNVISHGGFTNFCTPALAGGYEYTPVEMNRRDQESLKDKQNEALKVMPVSFLEEGYEVTVCDPVYANYAWIPDLTAFDDYPEIRTFNTEGKFMNISYKQATVARTTRNFFCFSLMKTVPTFLQPTIYNDGVYNEAIGGSQEELTMPQTTEGLDRATGANPMFLQKITTIQALPFMTQITDEKQDTFLFMTNMSTHEPQMLQLPNYTMVQNIDNSAYIDTYTDGITIDGVTLNFFAINQINHYHVNVASLLEMGRWFDYLRQQGVYDNTRIVLVSDHGTALEQMDQMQLGEEDLDRFFPILLVKDFNSKGFHSSDEFMTNADVPVLAMEGIIENPTNPFTGVPLTMEEKYAHAQFIIRSWDWDVDINSGNSFMPSQWASVRDNIWDHSNWTLYDTKTVLKEHTAP